MTLTVTPDPLIKGGQARVCISGGPPDTTVTVDIDNGGDQEDTLPVELDGNGDGCADWNVPGSWNLAKFNHDDEEVIRPIVASITG